MRESREGARAAVEAHVASLRARRLLDEGVLIAPGGAGALGALLRVDLPTAAAQDREDIADVERGVPGFPYRVRGARAEHAYAEEILALAALLPDLRLSVSGFEAPGLDVTRLGLTLPFEVRLPSADGPRALRITATRGAGRREFSDVCALVHDAHGAFLYGLLVEVGEYGWRGLGVGFA